MTGEEKEEKTPVLEIRGLTVSYKSEGKVIHAVNGLDLTLNAGEMMGLVGETGAGKTTTGLSVMGLLPSRTAKVEAGDIFFHGESLLHKSAQEREAIRGALISMIFQDPMTALNPTRTIGSQIFETLNIHNYEEQPKEELEARVDELLRMVGIRPERKDEYPYQFSGGMKQRVLIAMALACRPQILIADEPTTALDVTIQAQVLALLEELQEKLGTSVLLMTHDLGVVAQTCDRVAVVYAGEIVEVGSVEDIFSEGRHHPYTEGLFRSIPRLDDDRPRLTPIEGEMPDTAALPSGCPFHPRCGACMEICRKQHPDMVTLGDGHEVRCFLAGPEENGA